MKPRSINRLAVFLVLLGGLNVFSQTNLVSSAPANIRYAAIGDSYSIGEGASEPESWPALLARHLTASGTGVELGGQSFPHRLDDATGD